MLTKRLEIRLHDNRHGLPLHASLSDQVHMYVFGIIAPEARNQDSMHVPVYDG